jgi:hypothetical protein
VDRQATPAAETSFANGGQISVSHAEPWANPSAPLKVLKWLGQQDAPLLGDLMGGQIDMAFLLEKYPGAICSSATAMANLPVPAWCITQAMTSTMPTSLSVPRIGWPW